MASLEMEESPALPSRPANKSCENCRGLKVRCIPNSATPGQCERCSKAEKQCVFVARAKRRPRMRTGSKMAQLEEELAEMRSLLKDIGAKQSTQDEESSSSSAAQNDQHGIQPSPWMEDYSFADETSNFTNAKASASASASANQLYRPLGDMDVIDRGILSLATAQNLTEFFAQKLTDFFPIVLLSSDMDAVFLRRQKPILFLSIMAASAVILGMDIAETLHEELLARYARSFFLTGEKSLELIQAILLAAVFEYPPSSRMHLKLCQFTHVACTMALELGMHMRFYRKDKELSFDDKAAQARAILSCYHLASTNAIRACSLNMFPRMDFLQDCTHLLEDSANIHNRQLAYWFQLQRILDDTLMTFSPDNTRYKSPEERPQLNPILQYFNTRMQSWKDGLVEETTTCWVMLEYYNTQIVVYEAASGEAFRDPDALTRRFYMLPHSGKDRRRTQSNPPLNATWVDISAKWMDAAQGMLNIFLASDVSQVRTFPEIVFSRVFAALSSLLKIYDAARSTALGMIIKPDNLEVENYVDSIIQKLFLAASNGHYKVPNRWYCISLKKREWYQRLLAEDRSLEDPVLPFPPNYSVLGAVPMPGASGTLDNNPVTGHYVSDYTNQAAVLRSGLVDGAININSYAQVPSVAPFDTEEPYSRIPGICHGQWQL